MLSGGVSVSARPICSSLPVTALVIALSLSASTRGAVDIKNGAPGANGTAGTAGNPGTSGGDGLPGIPDPVSANTGLNFDASNTAQAHGGNGGNGGAGGNGLAPNGLGGNGGNGGNGGKGATAEAVVITNPGVVVSVVGAATAIGGNGGVLGMGGTPSGTGSFGVNGASGVGGDAYGTASGSAIGDAGVNIDATAQGGRGGNGNSLRASGGANGGFAQAVGVGTGSTAGANQFSVDASATGGNGGDATSPSGGNGGIGGAAFVDANANKSGAGIATVTSTAIGGLNAGVGFLPGKGGDATATANGVSATGITVGTLATGGAGPGTAVNGSALAHSRAVAVSGSSTAQANSGGATTPLVSAAAFAPVSNTTIADSRANAAGSFHDVNLADGVQSAAFATGTPLGSDVAAAVAGHPHASSMVAGADVLGLMFLQGAYPPNGSGSTRTYVSTVALTVDLTQVPSLKDLQLAAVDAERTGLGFDSLRLELVREGVAVVDETYTNSSFALALFQDAVFNLGDIETGIGDNLLDVTVRLSVTTNDVGAGFSSLFVLANSALPEWDADFDVDTDVDGVDLATWELGYGTGTMHSQGDADFDGDVDGLDFLIWQQQYTGPALPAAATVPEPASGVMLLVSASATMTRRRKVTGLQPRGFAC